MIICDYTNDIGIKYRRVKPFIRGLDIVTNQLMTPQNVLLNVSNYIPIDGYYEVGNREALCQMDGRLRRIIMRFNAVIYELDYYEPFVNLDWSVFDSEEVRVEVLPEFINHGNINTMMLQLGK